MASRNRLPSLTRVRLADLARRGHAMAEGRPEPGEDPRNWKLAFQHVGAAMEASQVSADLLNRFSDPVVGDDDDERRESEEQVAMIRLGGEPDRITHLQAKLIGRRSGALDALVN